MKTSLTPEQKKLADTVLQAAGRIRAGDIEKGFRTLEAQGWKRPDSCNNPQLRGKSQN